MIKITQDKIDSFIEEVNKWREDTDLWQEDGNEERLDVMIEELASGALGGHQPSRIAGALELEVPEESDPEYFQWDEDEFAWEEIESKTNELAEQINNMVGDKLTGQFYFGHLETDGSYGLMYTETRGGDEDTEETLENEEARMVDIGLEPSESVSKKIDRAVDKILTEETK